MGQEERAQKGGNTTSQETFETYIDFKGDQIMQARTRSFAYPMTKDLNIHLSTVAPVPVKQGTIISSSREGLLNQPSWKAICQDVKRA